MMNYYNNGFPASTYQPIDYQYPQTNTTALRQYYAQGSWQQPYQVQQTGTMSQQYAQNSAMQNGGIIWVQGEAGAKSYIVPNGMTVALWDSENQVIYIKSVDSSGKPSMTILDYVDRNATVSEKTDKQPDPVYVTIDKFNELNSQVADIKQKLNDFKPFASTTNNNRKGNNHNG